MPSVTFFKLRFTPSWFMLVVFTVFFLLFLRLGFWQMERADEKRRMIVAQKHQEQQAPVVWDKTQKLPVQYQNIKVQGHYLPQVFFWDNQHYHHQFGYNVISPVELTDGSLVLVDRGWTPGDITRRSFPNIEIPHGIININGSVYFPSKNQWVLGPALEKKDNKTTILERLDEHLVSQVLQKAVYPFIIRLDKQDSYGFVREWETVSMPPQRHFGYALQWFAIAFVVLIIFIALNLKKEK